MLHNGKELIPAIAPFNNVLFCIMLVYQHFQSITSQKYMPKLYQLITKKSIVALHSSSTHQESCKSSNPQRALVPVILPTKPYTLIAAVALGVCPQIRQILLQLICENRWGHRRRLYFRCKSIASNTQHHDDEQNR